MNTSSSRASAATHIKKLSREDLLPLEKYAEMRTQFRSEVMAHKKNRQVSIGPHATLYFEDRLTMQYQVQEMLRIERIFETAGINEELAAYNPLIPDGANWKATFMVEYDDENERREALKKLKGIEKKVWAKVAGFNAVWAIADEDMEREDETKTSAVHFLRFELTPEMVRALKQGAALGMGIDHGEYHYQIDQLAVPVRESLTQDLLI